MARNKYLLLFLFSLSLTAVSRHFYIEQYRLEMQTSNQTQDLDTIQQRASTFFEQDEETPDQDSNSAEDDHGHTGIHGHEHDSDHAHVTSLQMPYSEDDLKHHASKTLTTENEHQKNHGEQGQHEHHKHHEHHEAQDPAVSPGFVLLLRQLGFAELAANLLWIQMDADSHRGLWHRVEFALELIPALDPTFIDAYLLRSFLLDEYQKRHDEALQILENAVKQIPNRMELWQQIGLLCMNHTGRHGPTRRLPRALEAFTQLSHFVDAPPQAARLMAVTLAAMERRDEAIKLLQETASNPERQIDQQRIDLEMINRIRSGEKF